ncbi:MAG: UDP-glucose/GDP-mannose dehydrogenase family protein [Methylacidiphilales bacterium]|nr:UDP-glucose/GDP-mannose dehydrogenase family protein [Candidatus Methylacidiphilales bacterium]
MKLAIFGSGYVGLVSAVCFSEVGHSVFLIDIDSKKIASITKGTVPFYEPRLDELLLKNIKKQSLQATTDPSCITQCDIIFIAVGTPKKSIDGSTDLSEVLSVYNSIAPHIHSETIIVHKSTVPVGTAHAMKKHLLKLLAEQKRSINFTIVSNPEFLKEGNAVSDFMSPDRIIIGTDDEQSAKRLSEVYEHFNHRTPRVLYMDVVSAECTKYASNAFLATKISFMNELASLAEQCGANIDSIRKGLGSDSRIGPHALYAGCGYGGSCFPKDIDSLIQYAEQLHISLSILKAVKAVNTKQQQILLKKIKKIFGESLQNRHFLIWGLAFKPETDDVREASAVYFIQGVIQHGATVTVYDPVATETAREKLIELDVPINSIHFSNHAYPSGPFDALVIATEWKEFLVPKWDLLRTMIPSRTLLDGRNMYKPELVNQELFKYYSIGRPQPQP